MTKTFNIQQLLLLSFLMLTGIIISCEKKDNNAVSSNKIQLLSFGPSGAKHGDTLRFVGNNLDKVTSVQLTGVTVDKAVFISQTSELITLKIPSAAVRGYITLKTPEGDIVSKTQLDFKVPVRITSVTTEARPGANISIKGDFMNWVTRVTFGLNKIVETFVSKSLTELVVTVPLDAQTDKLTLNTSGTDPLIIITDNALIVTLPKATGFVTNPVKHADNVTITGTDLDLVKQVLFTNVTAPVTTFVSQSATQLVVKVPGGTKKGKITLVAASGVKTESTTELDLILPAVTGMSPNPVDPNANVTITGTNLNLVASIIFNNAAAVTTFVSQTPTQIVVKVPGVGVATGLVTFGVLNSSLSVQSAAPLQITGAAPPPTIAFPIYDDAVTSNWTSTGWIGGGWGGTTDRNNSSPTRAGTKSVKIDYVGGWGSPFQLGGASVNTSAYTTFKISVYAPAGTGGKKINIGINASDKYTITLDEGKWTDYAIPLSSLLSGTNLNEIWVKEYNGTGGFTIYIDALGLN